MTCVRWAGSARGCRLLTTAPIMIANERYGAIVARQPVSPPEGHGAYRRVSRHRQSSRDNAAPLRHQALRLTPHGIGLTR